MVAQPVEAVWVWQFSIASYKATYGRFSDDVDDSYSKDYLQVSGQCGDLLATLFGVQRMREARVDIRLCWPHGEQNGFVSFSSDRFHLAWARTEEPPPWKVGTSPDETTAETIPGDPNHHDAAGANAEWRALEERDLQPYLIAVKLRDEPDRLHLRAYMDNPPVGMEWAALSRLPESVQKAARSTHAKKSCASLEVSGGVAAEPEVTELVSKLAENPNVLLVGPPGTGKTVLLEKLANFVENGSGGLLFDAEKKVDAFTEPTHNLAGKAQFVVLHPAYTYEHLVVGLLPEPAPNGGVSVRPTPGPLVNLAQYARNADTCALLVLDEFNRGNAAAVLGDTIALLDKDKRGRSHVNLPFGDLGIDVPKAFAHDGVSRVPESFTLPPNLWLVAAMNSSDRSVAPLDAALRRRFSIVEMPPDYEALSQHLDAAEDPDFSAEVRQWTVGTVNALAVQLLRALNSRIDAVLGPDFRLGQSNFWATNGGTVDEVTRSLAGSFDLRIVSTLRLAMQDDDGALAAVLRAGTAESPSTRAHAVAYWKPSDPELGTYASPRLHLRELSALSPLDVLDELKYQANV